LDGARQVVTITASRWTATRGTAVAWQKRGRTWRAVRGPVKVALGAEGMSPAPRRPRGTTPAGVHELASAFGMLPDPAGALPYRRLDADDRWPHDRLSPRTYNVLQTARSPRATWRKRHELVFAKHQGSFEQGLVVDFNRPRRTFWSPARKQWMARRPADVRKGSLLVHTGKRVGGHGWVSVPTQDLAWLLRWANPAQQGTRIVVGTPKHLRDNL
jgi:L,D-peptidoglycan transpeptidase YkuD (ErfK/YbiS/YcfS/YnhG family)